MAEPAGKAAVLLLRSTNRHFPLDLAPELERVGHETHSLDSLELFIASPVRSKPFLAVMEIGSAADLERAYLVFEWVEQMQPLAPARYLLLLASKNLPFNERSHRFGTSAEIATLPQPTRNILFKLELQQRLLNSRGPTEPKRGKGFSAQFEVDSSGRQRILVARGPDDKAGDWRQGESSPQGKIRWRWVRQPDPRSSAKEEDFSWIAETKNKPTFDKTKDAWMVEGEEANLLCYRSDSMIFSAAVDSKKPSSPPAKEDPRAESAARIETTANILPEAKKQPEPFAGKKAKEATSDPTLDPQHPSKENIDATAEALRGSGRKENADPRSPYTEKAPAPWNAPLPAGKEAPEVSPKERAAPEENESLSKKSADPKITVIEEEVEGAAHSSAGLGMGVAIPWGNPSYSQAPNAPAKQDEDPSKSQESVKRAPAFEQDSSHGGAMPSMAKESVAPDKEIPVSESFHRPLEPERGEKAPAHTNAEAVSSLATPPAHSKAPTETRASDPTSSVAHNLEKSKQAAPAENAEAEVRAAQAANPGATSDSISSTDFSDLSTAPLPTRATNDQTVGSTPTRLEQDNRIRNDPAPPASTNSQAAFGAALSKIAELSSLKPNFAQPEKSAPQETEENPGSREPNSLTRVSGTNSGNDLEDSRRFLRDRLFLLMTLSELADKQSSWHPVGKYRIYLSAQCRYYGLPHPSEVLPLWIYEGELAPEFIDERQSWKFYDRLPVLAYSLETMPFEILEHIYQLAKLPIPVHLVPIALREAGKAVIPTIEPLSTPGAAADHYHPEKKKETTAWGNFVSILKKLFGAG